MNKLIFTLVAFLTLGGCADRPEPAAVETAAISVAAPIVDDNGPPPPPEAVQLTAPDAELEAAIRATDPNFRTDIADQGKTSYASARSDFNGDGKDEVFVYLMGPYFCGTGGCNLLVFSHGIDGYSLLASIPTSEALIIRAESQNEGYSDFWRMQSGGGMPAEFVRHQYKSDKYIEVSRSPGDTMPRGLVVMDETMALANKIILEPRSK